MTALIASGVAVEDFGGAQLVPHQHLDSSFSYQPGDLVKHSYETVVWVLNSFLLELAKTHNVPVFSGVCVLAYVNDLDRLMRWLPIVASTLIFFYVIIEKLPDPREIGRAHV